MHSTKLIRKYKSSFMEQQERNLIYLVRDILEAREISLMKIPQFDDFPNGSCSDASEILGCLLEEKGFGPYQLVSGTDRIGRTHAWIQSDDYRIDITADQFSRMLYPVLIEHVGVNSKVHIGFHVKDVRRVNLQNIFLYGCASVFIFVQGKLACG